MLPGNLQEMQTTLVLDKLLGLLDQVSEIYQSLLAVMDNEKDAVVAADLKKLNEAAKVKENLLLKLRILEEQRMHLLKKLADQLNHPYQDLTLTNLSQLLKKPHAKQLKARSIRLLKLLNIIQRANERNGSLFAHSLELVRGSLNLLNNFMPTGSIYFQTGTVQNYDRTGRLLCGEI
jgi:flagellar biosynthesis/type III secretory pathway chaperone